MHHSYMLKKVFSATLISEKYAKKLILGSVFLLAMLSSQQYVWSQTLTTTLSQPNIIVCDAPQELTVRVENNTALPLEMGTFSIDLDGLE